MQHSADYKFTNKHDRTQYVVRLHRGVATPLITEAQFERIAQMLLLLHLKVQDLVPHFQTFNATWTTESHGIFYADERFDIDSAEVIQQIGQEGLLRIAEEIPDSAAKNWLIQEADLLEEGDA